MELGSLEGKSLRVLPLTWLLNQLWGFRPVQSAKETELEGSETPQVPPQSSVRVGSRSG